MKDAYTEIQARVFAVAITASELQSSYENLRDSMEKTIKTINKNIKEIDVLDVQLVDLFAFLRTYFPHTKESKEIPNEEKTS